MGFNKFSWLFFLSLLFVSMFIPWSSGDLSCGIFRSDRCVVPSYSYNLIFSCDDLQGINSNLSGNYFLASNVDCSVSSGWNWNGSQYLGFVPIGNSSNPFQGIFDGQGFNVSNVFMNRSVFDYQGLFGYIDSGAEILNVGVIGFSGHGNDYVSALVAYNNGLIVNSFSSGAIIANSNAGGLVGRNNGIISRSFSSVVVNVSSTGGGLVGRNNGVVNDCYASGNIIVGSSIGGLVGENSVDAVVNRSYSFGSVFSGVNAGGLVGFNSGVVSNSFYDSDTSGRSDSGKGTGKTTVQLQDIMTFNNTSTVGLDVPWSIVLLADYSDEIWFIDNGSDYPRHGFSIFYDDVLSDYVLFKLNNYSSGFSGFESSHGQLRSFSPHYNYGVCCVSSNQQLTYDCSANNALQVLRLADSSNAHIQMPLVGFNRLLSFWDFEDGSGSTLTDVVSDNDGVIFNGNWSSSTVSGSGYSLYFNGSSYVEMGDVLDMFLDDFSISVWVKTSNTGTQYIVSKSRAASQDYRYGVYTNNGFPRIFMYGDSGSDFTLTSSVDVSDDSWHHLVFVFDRSGNASIFVNGSLDVSSSISTWVDADMNSVNPFRIGSYTSSDNVTASNFFVGNIDNVKVYNKVLTEVEIFNLYNLGKTIFYDSPVCIVGQGSGSCFLSEDSCPSSFECIGSLASSEENNDAFNYTNAHFASCDYYDLKLCCFVNSPPGVPVLLYPEHEDYFFTNRTPLFNWTSVSDPDGDDVSYQIQVSTIDIFNSTSTIYNISDLAESEYQITSELAFGTYHWRVRAYDGNIFSDWSSVFNFTLINSVIITLVDSNVTFGFMEMGSQNDTTDNSPMPFLFRNDGNIAADLLESNASSNIWLSESLDTEYWQIKARSNSSIDNLNSVLNWVNVSSNINDLIKLFNHTDGNDLVNVDVRVAVPPLESPGVRRANITFYWGASN